MKDLGVMTKEEIESFATELIRAKEWDGTDEDYFTRHTCIQILSGLLSFAKGMNEGIDCIPDVLFHLIIDENTMGAAIGRIIDFDAIKDLASPKTRAVCYVLLRDMVGEYCEK